MAKDRQAFCGAAASTAHRFESSGFDRRLVPLLGRPDQGSSREGLLLGWPTKLGTCRARYPAGLVPV